MCGLDRLVDDKDRKWLFELSQSCVSNHFKESFDVIFENLSPGGPKTKVKVGVTSMSF